MALLLVGHGSRDGAGNREFLRFVELVREAVAERPVEGCFLEFGEPDIEAGVARFAARGWCEVVVLPVMLHRAGHVERDIPVAMAAVKRSFPDLLLRYAAHLGADPALQPVLAGRLQAAGQGGDCIGLLVARGSSDPDANRHAAELAERLRQAGRLEQVEIGFLGVTQPSLEQALQTCAAAREGTVIVQPYLLFDGVMMRQIRRAVAGMRRLYPEKSWICGEPLGGDPALVQAAARLAGFSGGERDVACL